MFVNDKTEEPWKTIDRDRNITLIYKGAVGSGGPEKFEIDVRGQLIEFLVRTIAIVNNKKFDVTHKVLQIFSPEEQKNDLKEIIEEALKAYGLSYSPDHTNFVQVEFTPNI